MLNEEIMNNEHDEVKMMIMAMMTISTQVTASSFRATDTLISKEARLVVDQTHRLRHRNTYSEFGDRHTEIYGQW